MTEPDEESPTPVIENIDCGALFEQLADSAKTDQEAEDVLALESIYNHLLEVHANSKSIAGHAGLCRCREEYMSQFDQLVVHSAAELPAFAGGFHVIGRSLRSQYACCLPNFMSEKTLESLKEFWVALCTHFVLYMEEISPVDEEDTSSVAAAPKAGTTHAAKLLPHEEAALRR